MRYHSNGVLTAVKDVGLDRPLVVRLEGTNVKEGKKIIAESGLTVIAADDLKDGCIKAAQAAAAYRAKKGLAPRAPLPTPPAIAYIPKGARKSTAPKATKATKSAAKPAKKAVAPPAKKSAKKSSKTTKRA